jgi:hypothetical protein
MIRPVTTHLNSTLRTTLTVAAIACAAGTAGAQPCDGGRLIHRGPRSASELWPRRVENPNAVFDTVNGRLMLVCTAENGRSTELWEWDNFNWSLVVPQDGASPPAARGAAAVYHEDTGRILMFGGTLNDGTDSNRTWLWNGGFWDEPYFQDVPPQPLHNAGMAYLRTAGRAVIFGGLRDGAEIDETWTWGVGGWQLVTGSNGPRGQNARNTMAYSPSMSAVIFCDPGRTNRSPERDGVWSFKQQGWMHLSPTAVPGAGGDSPTAYEPLEGAIIRLITASDGLTQRWVCNQNGAWRLDRSLVPSLPAGLIDMTATTDVRRGKVLILGRRAAGADLELWEQTTSTRAAEISTPELTFGSDSNAYVFAAGSGELEYQWLRDGLPLTDGDTFEGVRTPSLSLATQRLRCGRFELSCRVCGTCGCATSASTEFAIHAPADFNFDGGVDGADVEAFITAWTDAGPGSDFNCDGGTDGADIEAFFVCWENNCAG